MEKQNKFPGASINELEGRSADAVPLHVPIVKEQITERRENAKSGIETAELSEKKQEIISELVIPAIMDTMQDVLGEDGAVSVDDINWFIDMYTQGNYEEYFRRQGVDVSGVIGTFSPDLNHITLPETGHPSDSPEDLAKFAKVLTHEFFHFFSHQAAGLRDNTRVHMKRVGVNTIGQDIRSGKEGKLTWDYFVAFDEAITEELAIQTFDSIRGYVDFRMPGGRPAAPGETYRGYRELLDAVLQDAIQYGTVEGSLADAQKLVFKGYLAGDAIALAKLAHRTYPGMHLKELGLMTSVDDLPTNRDYVRPDDPRAPKPPPAKSLKGMVLSQDYLDRLRDRIRGKTDAEYHSDVVKGPTAPSSPGSPPPLAGAASVPIGAGETGTGDAPDTPDDPESPDVPGIPEVGLFGQFREEVRQNREDLIADMGLRRDKVGEFVNEKGEAVPKDKHGHDIHYDEEWLYDILKLAVEQSFHVRQKLMKPGRFAKLMDDTLFNKRKISELSDGFDEMYILKHLLVDTTLSDEEYSQVAKRVEERIAEIGAMIERRKQIEKRREELTRGFEDMHREELGALGVPKDVKLRPGELIRNATGRVVRIDNEGLRIRYDEKEWLGTMLDSILQESERVHDGKVALDDFEDWFRETLFEEKISPFSAGFDKMYVLTQLLIDQLRSDSPEYEKVRGEIIELRDSLQ
jgi:hypothetical protein